MSVVVASDLLSCSGVHLSSSNSAHACPQVPDEEAVTGRFIPADGCSAVLISPRRILVTGGVLSDDRVLPFTVLRYLDLDPSPKAEHRWVKPVLLRPTSKKGKRKRATDGSTIPVCRIDHSLTLVPEVGQLFLIGGLKVGGKDEGTACKSMFSLDVKTRLWEAVLLEQVTTRGKAEQEHVLGPCLAHVAVYIHTLKTGTRDRKSLGYILVHGGYASTADLVPRSQLFVFDVRLRKWSLKNAAQGISAPQRAYHAAAATESCRYLVLHGGSCSHINEPTFMSSDLFVFDMVKSEWLRPKLLPTSADPPAARSRHCLVNGIGKHEGSFVMYGGFVATGESSSDMFLLTIIEPTTDEQQISAVWEKINVIAPERQLGDCRSPLQPAQSRPLKDAHSPATSGGCLIPVSAVNKYLVVGGRGPYGIRNAPLLLDATQLEYLDRLEPLLVNADIRPERTKKHDLGNKLSTTEVKARLRIKPPTPPNRSARVVSRHVKEKVGSSKKRQRSRLPLLPSSTSPAASVAAPGPQLSSLQPSQLEMSPVPIPPMGSKGSHRLSTANPPSQNSQEIQPVNSVHVTSITEVRKNKPTKDGDDIILNTADNDDDFLLPQGNRAPVISGSDDMETPPMKRRRFIEGTRKQSVQPFLESNEIFDNDGREMPDSAGSDFIAASEIAKKAVFRTGKSSRGRGRGRKHGASRGRAATVAEEREAMKEREAEEALNCENKNLIKQLRLDNSDLIKEKEALKNDNQDLNEQMKSLLSEIQTLRALKRLRGGVHDNFYPERYAENVGTVVGTGLDAVGKSGTSHGVVPPEVPDRKDSEELKQLRSKISDLQEECQEVVLERDDISKSLRAVEDSKRALEIEFNTFKNKSERIQIEKEQLRKQASELRTAVSAANATQETTKETIRRMERTISSLRREVESAQHALRDVESRRVEDRLQLSSAQRQMNDARGQLTEASKRYEQVHSKERQLFLQLESQHDMVNEMKKSAEEANEAKHKLEERNIELTAELEKVRTDLSAKLKDCDIAFQETERARSALDRERKKSTDLDIETTRLNHELKRSEKECHALLKKLRKKDSLLRTLGPSIAHITKVLGALTESSREDEMECRLLETSRVNAEAVDRRNGSAGPSNDASARPVNGNHGRNSSEDADCNGSHHVVNDLTAKESQNVTAGSENRLRGNEDRGVEEGEDAKSPVPPSDEGDES